MPRKSKKLEPITGPGKDPENKLTVQKSRPLLSLWRSDMTLSEFKILDTYLSRIDSHQPDKRTVIFAKGELEQLLGVKKINKSALSQRLNNLGRFVELEKPDHKMHKVALFEEAYGEMDEYGLWQIKLTCTPAAMKYIFNVEELGYLRYKLRCITSLTSRHTYILFMYLESNRFRKTWEVDVDELRHILKCDTEESYNEFKIFNQRILKKCQKELHEKSECRFTYEPIKKGRPVVAIRFTLETIPDILPKVTDELEGQQKLPWFDEYENGTPDAEQYLSGAFNNEFNREQIHTLLTIIADKKFSGDSSMLQRERYDYFRKKYALFLVEAERTKIKYRFNYFRKMINQAVSEEVESEHSTPKSTSSYDLDEYEKHDIFANINFADEE